MSPRCHFQPVAPLLFSLILLGGCASGAEPGADAIHLPPALFPPHAEPPAPSAEAILPDGAGHVTFAVSRFLVGDRDRAGRVGTDAWKRYGYDLDGLASGARTFDGFDGLCTPREGASRTAVQADGEAGIDNAFGATLLPLILGADPAFPEEVERSLAAGGTTLLVDLEALGSGTDYRGMSAGLYTGAPLGHAPAYDGSDDWPVRADASPGAASAISTGLVATDSYVTGNTWVGRFHGVLTVELPWLKGITMHLRIGDPVVTMALDPSRGGVEEGTIAGVIATEDLLAEARDEALRVDASLCPGTSTMKAILAEISMASDIMADGTQDPARTCDGISIGLGFSARRVRLGPVVAAPVIPPAECARP
jgi:hypothetical protein